MPSGRVHVVTGAIAGASVYAHWKLIEKKEDFSAPEMLTAVAAGAVFGLLPDLIEPATSPNHRAFFHGAAVLGGALLILYFLFRESDREALFLDVMGRVMATAYASHLVLDSFTPKSLPLIA